MIYYYQKRDGTILSTDGIDPFLSNSDDVKRVFRKDGARLKCVQDNDTQPWGYHLEPAESVEFILKASEPGPIKHLLMDDDLDDL